MWHIRTQIKWQLPLSVNINIVELRDQPNQIEMTRVKIALNRFSSHIILQSVVEPRDAFSYYNGVWSRPVRRKLTNEIKSQPRSRVWVSPWKDTLSLGENGINVKPQSKRASNAHTAE